MKEEIELLARRLCDDPRIATRTLWRMIKDIDEEMRLVAKSDRPVPRTVAELREIVARACLLRQELDHERGNEIPARRS